MLGAGGRIHLAGSNAAVADSARSRRMEPPLEASRQMPCGKRGQPGRFQLVAHRVRLAIDRSRT